MKFSIIFPTRQRTSLLQNLLVSIVNNTESLGDIEVLIAYDSDDAITHEYAKTVWGKNVPFKFFITKRSLNFSRDYYNMLAMKSTGKWIIVINDDAEFTTPGWDRIAEEALTRATVGRPNVVYGWVEDELGQHRMSEMNDYTCFPIFGREGVEALKGVFPARIPTWGADIWARYLYGEIRRVTRVPITIKHISHHNGTREQDEVNKHIAMNQVPIDVHPTDDEINALLQILRKTKK